MLARPSSYILTEQPNAPAPKRRPESLTCDSPRDTVGQQARAVDELVAHLVTEIVRNGRVKLHNSIYSS